MKTAKRLTVITLATAAAFSASVALASSAHATTGQNSSAVVSLGKLGRVEAQDSATTSKGTSAVVSLGKLGRVE